MLVTLALLAVFLLMQWVTEFRFGGVDVVSTVDSRGHYFFGMSALDFLVCDTGAFFHFFHGGGFVNTIVGSKIEKKDMLWY